jgi:hypothetical protein
VLIRGKYDDIEHLLTTVKGSDTALSLKALMPLPAELQGTDAPFRGTPEEAQRLKDLYGATDWYDWQVTNWGTKWDIEASIEDDSCLKIPGYESYNRPDIRTVKIVFDSAWAPPTPAIQMLAKQFPNTNIYHTYDESGCDFGGWAMYSNGECVKETETPSYYGMQMYAEPSEDIFDYFPDSE